MKTSDPRLFDELYQIVENMQNPGNRSFFYGVRTTGIFCRPGCSSRVPKRENIDFFENIEEAADAGFRPCRRCRPQDPEGPEIPAGILEACLKIESVEDEIPLSELAESAGLSAGYFQKVFKKTTGITPKEYARGLKARRFRVLLSSCRTVTAALYEAGYGSSSRVYEQTEKLLSMKPSQYRKSGVNQKIRYAVSPCHLGYVAAAFTQKGVCSIDLGSSEKELDDLVRNRFYRAELSVLSGEEEKFFRELISLADHPGRETDLLEKFPRDIRGTIFQEKVWRALRSIPPGETKTYSSIAGEIGHSPAVRAVANACGQNPLALVIPCHRVVRRDGGPGGYRWGEERKQMILRQEKEGLPEKKE